MEKFVAAVKAKETNLLGMSASRADMPKILEKAVKEIEKTGKSKSRAYAIATSSLQKSGSLKKGTNKATAKGKRRGAMTKAQRAKTRKH